MQNFITGLLLATALFLSYQLIQVHQIRCDDLVRYTDGNGFVCEINLGNIQEDEIPAKYVF
jgi:hypothetical protein